jgi:hypothetical protein
MLDTSQYYPILLNTSQYYKCTVKISYIHIMKIYLLKKTYLIIDTMGVSTSIYELDQTESSNLIF